MHKFFRKKMYLQINKKLFCTEQNKQENVDITIGK